MKGKVAADGKGGKKEGAKRANSRGECGKVKKMQFEAAA